MAEGMGSESLISWNLPNFITIVLMLAIVWVVIGAAGHLLVRGPYLRTQRGGQPASNTTYAPGGVAVVA